MGFLGGAISGFSQGVKKNDSDDNGKSRKFRKDPKKSYWQNLKSEISGSFKKGGKVKKTGIYKLHKNEVVVPAKKRRKRSSKRR